MGNKAPTKECCVCHQLKPLGEFHKHGSTLDGFSTTCKICANNRARINHHLNKKDRNVKRREEYYQKAYGISQEHYELLKKEQGECGICHSPLKEGSLTHLDHDHGTGVIREFLCTNCNRGLGHFHDSIKKLRSAILYLEKHNADK